MQIPRFTWLLGIESIASVQVVGHTQSIGCVFGKAHCLAGSGDHHATNLYEATFCYTVFGYFFVDVGGLQNPQWGHYSEGRTALETLKWMLRSHKSCIIPCHIGYSGQQVSRTKSSWSSALARMDGRVGTGFWFPIHMISPVLPKEVAY